MSKCEFVHLHNHTEYSLLDGLSRIKPPKALKGKVKSIVERLTELHMDAFALTDHGVMYGAIDFYKGMIDAGLKPIIGVEAYISLGNMEDKGKASNTQAINHEHILNVNSIGGEVDDLQRGPKPYHLTLLAENLEGYKTLMRVVTAASTRGMYYRPRIDFDYLSENHNGLICLTGCANGPVAREFIQGNLPTAKNNLEKLLDIFGHDNVLVEIMDHGLPFEKKFIPYGAQIAKEYNLKLVATNDTHYIDKKDSYAHDIALCIQTGRKFDDPDRLRYVPEEFYIRSAEEMRGIFPQYPEAITNTLYVAERVDLRLELDHPYFPRFELPVDKANLSHADYLTELTMKKAIIRFKVKSTTDLPQQVLERLKSELDVIIDCGFATYFLIVADFIAAARERNIPVGPGRGSGAGSLVAFCLEITDIDPLRHNLLFERFLNRERVSLPDFDIDFCERRRGEVIDYVRNKYGADKVSQIVTFNRLKAKAAIRAVGRTKNVSLDKIGKICDSIVGISNTIDEALEESSQLKEMFNKDDETADVIETARFIEGLASHKGVHAAGVLIAPGKIEDFVPAELQKDTHGKENIEMLVCQYDMNAAALAGLVKMDFLGLRTLTLLDDTVKMIKALDGPLIDLRELGIEDEKTYELFAKGNTYGVFQFERAQIRKIMRESQPKELEDLTALNSLNRPGPLQSGMDQTYINNRRDPDKAEHIINNSAVIDVLKPTNGVLLYQEQVMQLAQKVAGYTLGEADLLRRAMGKKKPEELAKLKGEFTQRSVERGMSSEQSERLFSYIENFADYGFNKSHSAAYALLAYQTAYLKVHFPCCFMATLANSWMNSRDNLKKTIHEINLMGIKILPPDINLSRNEFYPEPLKPNPKLNDVKGWGIRFGLGGIQDLGSNTISFIQEARKSSPFKDVDDLLTRVDNKMMNKSGLSSLIFSGALDSLDFARVDLITNLKDIIENRTTKRQEALFGEMNEPTEQSEMINPFKIAELEKSKIGFFLSSNPYATLPIVKDKKVTTVKDLRAFVEERPKQYISQSLEVGGIITSIDYRTTKSKHEFKRVLLEDDEELLEVTFFEKAIKDCSQILELNKQVIIRGYFRCDYDDEENQLMWDTANLRADSGYIYEPGKRTKTNKPSESEEQKIVNRTSRPKSEVAATGNYIEAPDEHHLDTYGSAGSNAFVVNPIVNEITIDINVNLVSKHFNKVAEVIKANKGDIRLILKLIDGDAYRHIVLDDSFKISNTGILLLQQLIMNSD